MEIDRSELMDDIEEIQAKVDGLGFMGSNENDLWRREEISKYIVKKLALCSVVKQSELLIAFAEWKEYNGKWETHEQQVKNFLKEYKSN